MMVNPRRATTIPVKCSVVSLEASTWLVNEISTGRVSVCTSVAIPNVMLPGALVALKPSRGLLPPTITSPLARKSNTGFGEAAVLRDTLEASSGPPPIVTGELNRSKLRFRTASTTLVRAMPLPTVVCPP